jgi:sugar phosphate isomerase/epimerase
MMLSVCSNALRDRGYEEAFRIIAQAGFKGVELYGKPPHLEPFYPETETRKINECARSLGLQIVGVSGYDTRPCGSSDENERAAAVRLIKAYMRQAHRLGAGVLRVQSGTDFSEAGLERVARSYRECVSLADELGVCIGMENHDGVNGGSPEGAMRIASLADSPYVGVTYDSGNLLAMGIDPVEAVKFQAPKIVNVHLQEASIEREGDSIRIRHHIIGCGMQIDFRAIIETLRSIGYVGPMSLEHVAWKPPLSELPIDESLCRCHDYLSALVSEE